MSVVDPEVLNIRRRKLRIRRARENGRRRASNGQEKIGYKMIS